MICQLAAGTQYQQFRCDDKALSRITLLSAAQATHRGSELRLVGACILQVQLDVGHGVGDVEGLVLALVHRHDVGGDAVVHDVVRLIDHDVHEVEPAAQLTEA